MPNPFNPRTEIRFDLPAPGHVQLEIFDIAGRQVRILVDDEMPAGRHKSIWRGIDERGRSVSSGVYFYRLTAAGRQVTRKMLLLQ